MAATATDLRGPMIEELNRLKACLERLELWIRDSAPARFPVRREVSCDDILSWVSYEWGMRKETILERNNSPMHVEPRSAAMYLARKLTMCSLPEIGKNMGGYHHTTVLHAVESVEKKRVANPRLDGKLAAVETKLGFNKEIAASTAS